jgi:hypothetical protein
MGVLLILMTIAALAGAAIVLIISLVGKMIWLRNFVFGALAVWLFLYSVMLLGTSLTSHEETLAMTEAKAFCGFYLDCHLHASVNGVRKLKTLGDLTAAGQFYVVTVKVLSDARAATLGLLTVDAHVVDAGGRMYRRDTRAEEQLGKQPPFEELIGPGESFEKEIVFDLPVDAQDPRLDLREGFGIDHAIESVLVGDEDSLLHKRSYFSLEPAATVAGNGQ